MDKLKMMSVDGVEGNIEKIGALFPNCVTERLDENGKVEKAIDFEMLKQELSHVVVDGAEERYQFTWPDKKKSILLANAPINKTLRPVVCDEQVPTGADTSGQPYISSGSVGKNGEAGKFDSENLYIEGDNLDALKLLQETYMGKIKMIYIDPPYNTGKDFIYSDDFAMSSDEYMENSGQLDEQGNRLFQNNESNGRFHTDWLNIIYPRLKLAKDLLSEDGVIFISIDDNEQANLKKICDDVFGASNFIAQIIWERAYSPVNLKKHFSECHDYIICYAKNIENALCLGLTRTGEANDRYSNPDNDFRGVWKSSDFSVGPRVEKNVYEIISPSGRKVMPPSGRCWRVTREKYKELLEDGRVWFGESGDNVPSTKRFLTEVKQGMTPMTIWKYTEVGHSQDAAKRLKDLFDGVALFDYPKSVDLIKRMLQLYSNDDNIILDFFSGSATTAHAVMQLNAEDGGNRKFIMVQLPEVTDEKTEAYKAGYKNICEIGKERIRRAGKKIAEKFSVVSGKGVGVSDGGQSNMFDEQNKPSSILPPTSSISSTLDIGFRVLKLDSSNMKDVYYRAEQYSQNLLEMYESNIKEDRNSQDLLVQVMLDMGVLLSSKIEEKEISGKKVFIVGEYTNNIQPNLIACFDDNLSNEIVTAIAKMKPLYTVFRDSSFANDSVATNFEQIFTTYSPTTTRKVI